MPRIPEPDCPFQPLPNGVQTTLKYSNSLQVLENVLWFVGPSGFDDGDLLTFNEAVVAAIITHLLGTMPTTTQVLGARSVDWRTATGSAVDSVPGTATFGTATGITQPLNVTFALHKNTPGRGRGRSGRLFLPGITRDFMSGTNTMSAASAGAIVDAYNAFLDDLADVGGAVWQAVVVHKYVDHTCLTALDPTAYSTFSYKDLTLDSMRRRLPGRGI